MGLTVKQEKFCNKYVECGNASEAYRHAYDCKRMMDKSVWEKSCELLKSVNVASRVRELQSNLQKSSDITKEKVLSEFAKVAFSSIAYLHNTWIERKEFEQLTDDQKASIKSISTKTQRILINEEPVEVEYVKIELYDKLKALENINKMLGFESPIKTEHAGKDGGDINITHKAQDHKVIFENFDHD